MNSNSTTGCVTNSNRAAGSATNSNRATGSAMNSNRRAGCTTNSNYATEQSDNATSLKSINTKGDEEMHLISAESEVASYHTMSEFDVNLTAYKHSKSNTEDEDAADEVAEDENQDEEMRNRELHTENSVSETNANLLELFYKNHLAIVHTQALLSLSVVL